MSNVIPLFPQQYDITSQLRHWFMDQAIEPAGHLAAVSVAITADGMVKSRGCGVEDEHAPIILEELKAMVGRLEKIVAGEVPATKAQRLKCQVLPMRSRFAGRACA